MSKLLRLSCFAHPCLWIALALVAGCATPVPVPLVHKPPEFIRTVLPPAPTLWADVLRNSRTRTADALAQDTKDAIADGGAGGRLHWAMLLSAHENAVRDEIRAGTLAEEVAARPDATTPQRDAAVWYAWWLDAQRQLEQQSMQSQSRSRDDQARIEALDQRIKELERRAQEGEKRAIEAERKLEALKQIERTLNERIDRPPVAPAPQPGASQGAGGR
jgi:hypothetical protein